LAGSSINTLVITRLAASGASVKKGDLLVEFDRQNEIKNALDKQADYLNLEDQIKKMQATQAAALAKDQTELKQAEDAVESASLEIRRNEVVSRIDAEKNLEALEEAKADLKQLRETFNLKRRAAEAEIRLQEIQRDQSKNAMLHAQENAEKMSIASPIDGLVVMNPTWKGGRMAEVQEGDEVRPGVVFMQVVDPRAMQVRVKVNQADVPYLQLGQAAQVRLDAYPELVFPGRLDQVAAIGVTSGFSDKVRTFTARFSIKGSDPKLMPDLSASVDVELERVRNVLVAPRDAVRNENGQAFVNVKNGFGFERRAVKAGAADDVEVVIESGLQPGALVLRN
jgi:HlyD family secretion protein